MATTGHSSAVPRVCGTRSHSWLYIPCALPLFKRPACISLLAFTCPPQYRTLSLSVSPAFSYFTCAAWVLGSSDNTGAAALGTAQTGRPHWICLHVASPSNAACICVLDPGTAPRTHARMCDELSRDREPVAFETVSVLFMCICAHMPWLSGVVWHMLMSARVRMQHMQARSCSPDPGCRQKAGGRGYTNILARRMSRWRL